eukprot:865364_1
MGAPAGVYNATFLGPPGGYATKYYGWTIYDDKLYMNANYAITKKFFTGNITKNIEQVNAYWTSWFGSLDNGVLNYGCIMEPTMDSVKFCNTFGQPYTLEKKKI